MALSALIGAWLAGMFGGVHCVAMCGGFVTAMAGGAQRDAARVVPLRPARVLALRQLQYNAGRITTYALIGALAGGAGDALLSAFQWAPVQRVLFGVANICLLALAISIASKRDAFSGLQRVGRTLFARALPVVQPLVASDSGLARYALGLVWGLVPCALIYGVVPIALFSGGALEGAAVMAAFGLGTLPNLLAAGWLASRIRRAFDGRSARFLGGGLLGGFAAVGLWRAAQGGATLLQGPFCL